LQAYMHHHKPLEEIDPIIKAYPLVEISYLSHNKSRSTHNERVFPMYSVWQA
jgi:hypothetical protein